MHSDELHRATIRKLIESQSNPASEVEFTSEEAELAGAFQEDAIDESDIDQDAH